MDIYNDTSSVSITALSAKRSAKLIHYGNIVAMLFPLPFFILWFGGAMMVFALNRHHPNPLVGKYTHNGGRIFFPSGGVFMVSTLLIPYEIAMQYWWLYWLLNAVVVITLSLIQIYKINHDEWVALNVKN